VAEGYLDSEVATLDVVVEVPVTTDATITASDVTIERSKTANVSFTLNSPTKAAIAEFKLYLPKGITIKYDADEADYVYELGPDMTVKTHAVTIRKQDNGAYYVLVSNSAGKEFKAESGNYLTLTLEATADAESGTAQIRQIIIGDLAANQLNTVKETTFAVNVSNASMTDNGWFAHATTTGDVQTLVDNELLTAKTVYTTETGTSTRTSICGQQVDNYYIKVRVADAPTTAVPTGTNHGVSAFPATPLVITPKQNVEVSFFIRRQDTGSLMAFNDGKDLKVVSQSNVGNLLTGIMETDAPLLDDEEAYVYAKETYCLSAGETYTVYSVGTTIQLYGFTYKAIGSVNTPAPTFQLEGNTLTINSVEGATVYYTLDGSIPTTSSSIYKSAITLSQNCTVTAFATLGARQPSDVVSLKVDWFKVENVSITFTNLKVQLSTTTTNARIYYTIDGTEPTEASTLYTGPFAVAANCTVKARAYKENYEPSDVTFLDINMTNVRCEMPVITTTGPVLTLTTATEGAAIYYTLDGSNPDTSGTLYTGPVTLSGNVLVQAVAKKDGYLASETATYQVTYFQVEMPSFSVSGNTLTIMCGTPGAKLFYSIGKEEEVENMLAYTAPILLTDDRTVYAIGVLDGYRNSAVAQYKHTVEACGDVAITFDGRQLQLSTETEGATIYYTTDGSNPTEGSLVYDGSAFVNELCTVSAIAIKEGLNNSKVSTMEIPYYYNGTVAETRTAGTLSNAFEWNKGKAYDASLTVKGNINAADLLFVKEQTEVEHLDLAGATIEEKALPDQAFANMSLVSVTLPAKLETVGQNLFAGCGRLAAVVWNADIKLTNEAMAGVDNPNMLAYVNTLSKAPSTVRNVVSLIDDEAKNIVLEDVAEGNGNFYCPRPFTAKTISYTHNYTLKSGKGGSGAAGWETIALPFDVATVTHERNGLLAPFDSYSYTQGAKPFWLYSLQHGGFSPAVEIVANTPYIICMPNHEDYSDEYNQYGAVTFAATDVMVPATTVTGSYKETSASIISLIPTYSRMAKSSGIYAINREIESGVFAPGSIFVENNRDVRPFEAYSTVEMKESESRAPAFFAVMDQMNTGIVELPMDSWRVKSNGTVRVYNLSGYLVTTGQYGEVLPKLPKGVYIINGRKVVVK
jgi:hypothetical protein